MQVWVACLQYVSCYLSEKNGVGSDKQAVIMQINVDIQNNNKRPWKQVANTAVLWSLMKRDRCLSI